MILRLDLASNDSRSIVLCRLRFEVTSGLYKVFFHPALKPHFPSPRANCCRDFRAILSASVLGRKFSLLPENETVNLPQIYVHIGWGESTYRLREVFNGH